VAHGCNCVWNQFTVRVPSGRRDALQQFFNERKIGSAVYYPIPLHLQKCFAPCGYERGSLPASEQAAEEVLSLPIYGEMTRDEQDRVIEAIAAFCGVAGGTGRGAKAA
jgi:dTDP-4-amino-4,6-dideoxygalactose transaminase